MKNPMRNLWIGLILFVIAITLSGFGFIFSNIVVTLVGVILVIVGAGMVILAVRADT